ncbi:hypothetical protein [Mycolicibacterium sp.]|uniref:hypothetical protein n=1 Tax=Mycolicibacterium sp. TaxID=2320850 RepID=UPI0037CCA3F8
MALAEAEKAELISNQFAYDGSNDGAEYVRHLPCDTGIYLGEPQDVQKAMDHLATCPTPDGPAETYRGERPWPKGSPTQEAKKEAKKEEWLSRIKEHSGTTDQDYAAAVTMLVDPLLPVDPASAGRLEAAGFAVVNTDGTCAAVDAW